jgi:uncharacterized protein YllA (UPF0747 family)
MLPAFRNLAAPALSAAVEAAPELTAAVMRRNGELAAAGYHAQVHVEDHTSFVFLLENGKRLGLRRAGDEYVHNSRRFTSRELMERGASLSPNALLRPVIQDSMLPTVAYVGGPAEVAYLAQSESIYQVLLGRMPVAMPRAGFTVLDARSAKLMERYRLPLSEFFHGETALQEPGAACAGGQNARIGGDCGRSGGAYACRIGSVRPDAGKRARPQRPEDRVSNGEDGAQDGQGNHAAR